MALADLLRQTATVEAFSYSKDSAGGPVPTFAPVGDSVNCSIQPSTGHAVRKFAQRQIFITHTAFFNADPGLKRGYRLTDQDGVRYTVEYFSPGQGVAGRGVLWEAHLMLQTD